MSRATSFRFNYIAQQLYRVASGVTRALRVVVFCVACFGLSACVEGVDLPEFVTNIQQNIGEMSTPKAQDVGEPKAAKKRSYSSRYMRKPTKVDSKALLEAKGNWNLIEQGGAMDPTQAHLKAREEVNVRRRKNKKELSAHFLTDAKSGEDGKMRVLRLERDGVTDGKKLAQFDLAESSVVKPTHTVAESDLLRKIKALFGEEDAGSKSLSDKSLDDAVTVDNVTVDAVTVNAVTTDKSVDDEVLVDKRLSDVSGIIMPGHKPSRVSTTTAALNEESEHMIGGTVVPPKLPASKIAELLVSWDMTGESHKALEKPAAMGIVRPRIKPRTQPRAQLVVSANKVEQSAAITQERVQALKIRSGKHKGKTRLVIEVTEPTEYKVAIDHVRNVLRIKFDNTHWAMPPQSRFDESALLGTYIAREQSDGSVLFEVRLKKQSKIIDTVLLRPNLSSKHRIVIDLKD